MEMEPLEGIDLAGTIRRLDLPLESLRPLYFSFAEELEKCRAALRRAVAGGDRDAVRQHAHALAGAAGNLGVSDLHGAAKALEVAGRTGQPGLDDLLREVERCAEIVSRSLALLEEQADAGQLPAPPGGPFDPSRFQAALERLRQSLEALDLSGSAEAIQEIAALPLPEALAGQVGRLRKQLEGYHFDEAGLLAEGLLSALRGRDLP